tara:strand:- start:1305 stop:1844 length:540 start_codon:yes stop_codon:yes gene_type:complete
MLSNFIEKYGNISKQFNCVNSIGRNSKHFLLSLSLYSIIICIICICGSIGLGLYLFKKESPKISKTTQNEVNEVNKVNEVNEVNEAKEVKEVSWLNYAYVIFIILSIIFFIGFIILLIFYIKSTICFNKDFVKWKEKIFQEPTGKNDYNIFKEAMYGRNLVRGYYRRGNYIRGKYRRYA